MAKRSTLIVATALILTLVALQYFQRPARPTIFATQSFEAAQDDAERATPPKLLVVDFAADWCAPCRQMDRSTWTSPMLTDWLKQHAVTIKIDIDEDKARARAFGITSIPTVVVLRDRKEVARLNGLTSASAMLERLQPLLTP